MRPRLPACSPSRSSASWACSALARSRPLTRSVLVKPLQRCAARGLLLALAALAACSFPGDEAPWAASGGGSFVVTTAALPAPLADPQPLNPTITLSFSDFPDPQTVQFPGIRLGPRGFANEYLVETRLVERQIVLRPRAQLLPENDYYFEATTALRALTGLPLPEPFKLRFRTGKTVAPPPAPEPPLTLADVLGSGAGLRQRCAIAACHSRDGGLTPARGLDLGGTIEDVRAQLGAQAGSLLRSGPLPAPLVEPMRLVEPGAPERSYLLRKLLAHRGFVRISGDPMPPPLSSFGPLDDKALSVVQSWIRQGAR
jgi:hypothetical protein